jgi:hypothetical protein
MVGGVRDGSRKETLYLKVYYKREREREIPFQVIRE